MATEKLTFQMNAVGNAVPEMKKVQTQLGSLDQTMKKSTANMNRQVKGMHNVARANKGMTRGLGMASLQFQDMAVQASMGTDALRIMTMQGPQLASIFGPKGMILGALIAVGGALALMGDRSTKLSFDFKRFGSDMKVAFKPLIDFVRPAIDLVKKGFSLLKTGAMAALNGLVNGINTFAVVVSNIPAMVKEAFSRSVDRLKLFKVQFGLFVNEISFRWLNFTGGMKEGFAETIDSLASLMNDFMGTDFATNNLEEAMKSSNAAFKALNREFGSLIDQESRLREKLDKPYESYQALQDDLKGLIKIDIFSYFKRVAREGEDAADTIGNKVQTVAGMIGDKFGDAFMSLVDGTKSAKSAFRAMAGDIIKELYRVFVVKQITGFISNAIMGAFPSFGATPMKAIGGPVQRGNPYVVGERGPELFVPSRSGSIVSNDNMSGGGGVTVVQNINVSTGVQQTVRTEIKSLMPQIAESAKAAVADAKRRGGSYGRAFA